MEKEKNLILGFGGAGNRLTNTLMNLDRRYTSIFLNSNMSEMEKLEHFDSERRCFYIPNADGCGKDMNKMEAFCKEEAPKFMVMIKKFTTHKYVTILTSANGGTGAMATIMYSKLIKKACPEKSINVIATYPALTETSIDFDNATRFWNEMINLKKKGYIDSIRYIDNNKGDEEEINIRAMKELNESYDMANGKLDTTDSAKVHCSNGYKVYLKLDKNCPDLESAIDKAIKESVFYMPDIFECDKMIADINTQDFDPQLIKEEFEYYDFGKFNENTNGETKILLGGCEMPKEAIELVREALKETKKRKRRRTVQEDLIIRTENNEDKKEDIKAKTKTRLSADDLNDMFKDDSFWED
ncbi:FtsZ/tubulin family protein [Clostridium botulinum]|uniref:hypothetical protein n=1 Tax=Clostridium botulinum TaxID=1491 RepID=UPI001C9BA87C|nr:hypothetical protein [Clostridium botulinum]MBY6842797.1 hypothetical protein [Clostridium botulinum]